MDIVFRYFVEDVEVRLRLVELRRRVPRGGKDQLAPPGEGLGPREMLDSLEMFHGGRPGMGRVIREENNGDDHEEFEHNK